jgi:predicted nucleotidyltransferase component of viral defense system
VKSKPPRDRAASVRQRLLNLAKERGDEFNFVLLRYGLERLLFRLGQSSYAGTFVLKGAMLFPLWSGSPHRATKDMDLLGSGPPDITRFVEIFREVAAADADDGVRFLPDTVAGVAIREEAIYDGIRITLEGRLGVARMPLQVDVGFGDAVTPSPVETSYPVLLADMPNPRLRVYARETAIAEKVEAMVTLGFGNSRMKDFFDIWYLARTFEFDEATLGAAIRATFVRRQTTLPKETPVALTSTFAEDPAKGAQWRAFIGRTRPVGIAPGLREVVEVLVSLLKPLFAGDGGDSASARSWRPGPSRWM